MPTSWGVLTALTLPLLPVGSARVTTLGVAPGEEPARALPTRSAEAYA